VHAFAVPDLLALFGWPCAARRSPLRMLQLRRVYLRSALLAAFALLLAQVRGAPTAL
jgi:hypothetical protein